MIEVRRRQDETPTALLFRFSKRVKRSGVLKEAKKRRFKRRPVSRRQHRLSAQHREAKRKEMHRLKRLGLA